MSGLSEVSVLIAQRASDIEKAREVFTAEIRAFVTGILGGVRRIRSDPWTTPRVRVELPREIDFEAKAVSDFSSQFAVGRVEFQFKKRLRFQQIAEVRFGVEFDEESNVFVWQVSLVPAANYNRVDDVVWHQWKVHQNPPPNPKHFEKANTIRFLSRPVSPALTAEVAFNDVKGVLEFLLTTESPLSDAIGLDASED
jgi:hypothetical protein